MFLYYILVIVGVLCFDKFPVSLYVLSTNSQSGSPNYFDFAYQQYLCGRKDNQGKLSLTEVPKVPILTRLRSTSSHF